MTTTLHSSPSQTSPAARDSHVGRPAVTPLSALTPALVRIALLAAAWLALLGISLALRRSFDDLLLYTSLTIIPIDLACIWFVARRATREGGLRSVVDFKPVDIAWGLLAGVIMVVAFGATSLIGMLAVYHGLPKDAGGEFHVPLWFGIIALVVMPATIAIAEEMVYRGYAQTRLRAATNKWTAWIVVAVLFSAQHIFLTPLDWRAQLSRFISLLLCGLVFGALAWWWKRITPLIIGHWLLDVLGLGMPLFLASLGR